MSKAPTSGALELIDVDKSFDLEGRQVEVLKGVSFTLEPGGALTITGPSGSGKSTLLHLIGTLDHPTAGEILYSGESPWDLSEPELAHFRNRTIGFVFQDSHLLPQFSVLENVLLPSLAATSTERGDATERAKELLDSVGLGHRLGHRPAELSGGERQRAAVARALINAPPLVLCDEPTGSLDASNAAEIGTLLLDVHRARGVQLVVVTHSGELAARFERRLELREGRCYEA